MYNMLHRFFFPKGTTVYTNKIQPEEFIHMDFDFYNLTPIHGFTSIRSRT